MILLAVAEEAAFAVGVQKTGETEAGDQGEYDNPFQGQKFRCLRHDGVVLLLTGLGVWSRPILAQEKSPKIFI
jgi:hypothetical protein